MNWQPIETAPKDGTEILGWRRDCGILLVRWDAPENFVTDTECEKIGESAEIYDWFCAGFVAAERLDGSEAPTLWQPLPDEPDSEKGVG